MSELERKKKEEERKAKEKLHEELKAVNQGKVLEPKKKFKQRLKDKYEILKENVKEDYKYNQLKKAKRAKIKARLIPRMKKGYLKDAERAKIKAKYGFFAKRKMKAEKAEEKKKIQPQQPVTSLPEQKFMCPFCKARVDPDSKFCNGCGTEFKQGDMTEQAKGNFCGHCGRKIFDANAKFCGICGGKRN